MRAIVTGVGAAGAGMFIGTAIKLGRPLAKKPAAQVLIAGAFLRVAVARVSLVLVLPVSLAPFGISNLFLQIRVDLTDDRASAGV